MSKKTQRRRRCSETCLATGPQLFGETKESIESNKISKNPCLFSASGGMRKGSVGSRTGGLELGRRGNQRRPGFTLAVSFLHVALGAEVGAVQCIPNLGLLGWTQNLAC
jgi:hypothetical protein